ncbi:MAG TPA: Flp family type IVb pilin [Candidatus Hypogeohydataceae bacterium YC41]
MLTRMYVELGILKDSVKERFWEALRRIREEKDGAAMVEYGILVAGIAVASIAIIIAVGATIKAKFTTVNTELGNLP